VKETKPSPFVAEHITRRFSVAVIATGIITERYAIPLLNTRKSLSFRKF